MNDKFGHLDELFKSGSMTELAIDSDSYRYLLIKSLGRSENYKEILDNHNVDKSLTNFRKLPKLIFESSISDSDIINFIANKFKEYRSIDALDEESLSAELYKLRTFDWGGVYQNDINRFIVDNYVKKYINYDKLISAIDNEIIESLRGFTLCSWYNNWTSIIIENIFNQHNNIIPDIGKIKMIDFFINEIPFDLKVAYFPAGFMAEKRRERGLSSLEISELKRICKYFDIPFDKKRKDSDLIVDITAALRETSILGAQLAFKEFRGNQAAIIDDTIESPIELMKWLYENQGSQRFDTSNRIFLILIDRKNLEESWKLKRDKLLLERNIESFLDSFPKEKNSMLVEWVIEGSQYVSHANILFITK